MNLAPSFLSSIPNSSAANAVDIDRMVLGGVLGINNEQYISQKASGILGGFPKKLDLEIQGEVFSIPSESVGSNTSDLSPFSFLGKEIPIELPEMKSAINALFEACMKFGLRGEELRKVVSENAKQLLDDEIARINDYIKENKEEASLEELDILIEYRRRLGIETRKFGEYLIQSRVQESKAQVENTLNIESSEKVSEKKGPIIATVSWIGVEVKNIVGLNRNVAVKNS